MPLSAARFRIAHDVTGVLTCLCRTLDGSNGGIVVINAVPKLKEETTMTRLPAWRGGISMRTLELTLTLVRRVRLVLRLVSHS